MVADVIDDESDLWLGCELSTDGFRGRNGFFNGLRWYRGRSWRASRGGFFDCDGAREDPENADGAKNHRRIEEDPAFLFPGQFEFEAFSSSHEASLIS